MTPLVRRCAAPLSLAVAAGLMVSAPSQAAPAWVPAAQVQNDGVTVPTSPVVAVDAEGAATMVWLSFADPDYTVYSSTHPVGGTWSAPQALSAPNAVEGELDLAVGAAGDAVVAWTEGVSPDGLVRARTRTAGGAWSPTVTISDPAADSSQPTVGIDSSGSAVALWVSDVVGDQPGVVGRTRTPSGDWAAQFPLSDPENGATDPDVAVAPDGGATAVWSHYDTSESNSVIESSSRPSAASAFEAVPAVISTRPTTVDAARPRVAVNGAGAATAAWEERTGADASAVLAATRAANGDWAAATPLSVPLADPSEFDENGGAVVVLDAAGTSTVAWRRHHVVAAIPFDDHLRTVESRSAAAGQGWAGPTGLGGTSSDSGLDLVVDAAGTVTAAWPSEGTIGRVSVNRREVGGDWAGAIGIESGPGRTNGVAAAASLAGDVVVGYGLAPNPDAGILYARAFDVDAPLVRSVSIPGTGTAGQPTPYAIASADAWSPVATSWSFGDGSSASGASVSHTFAAAGTYSVSVTVTDAVGNARTRTGMTVVAAAPVVTPPATTPKPQVAGVRLTKKTIHVLKSDDKPTATKLKLSLNTDAKVTVRLKRTKKVDGKTVKAGLTKALDKGSSAIKLTSKVGGKLLPPGTYKVTMTAKNSVGTSAATTLKLTIKA